MDAAYNWFTMLLAVDIGNTEIKLGVFEDDALVAKWRFATESHKLADEYAVLVNNLLTLGDIDRSKIHGAVYASVVPALTATFAEMFSAHFGVSALRVGIGVKTGIRIQYEPRELAPDRIAEVLGALRLHKPPIVLVHLGTGTVFEAISRDGEYLGGAIAPGLGLAADALSSRAAMLRSVEFSPPKKAIGTNTVAAMQSGILFGYAELIEGMVRRFKDEVGEDAWVIATGGWANLMHELTRCFDRVDENLTLYGLKQVYEMNEGS